MTVFVSRGNGLPRMDGYYPRYMATATFIVVGMTCGHCVASVKREVTAICGVTEVDVQLGSGRLTVESVVAIDTESVVAAVESAGYELDTPTSVTRMNLLGGGGCNCGCGVH